MNTLTILLTEMVATQLLGEAAAEMQAKHSAIGKHIYRGVHARHPAIAVAREGKVVPANPAGLVTPEEHNLEIGIENSPFTSWTHDYEIARRYAQRHGPGGLILSFPVGSPMKTDVWSWVWSPDEWGEYEILLRGERTSATVEFV